MAIAALPSNLNAQEFNDEMKRNLRQSLLVPEQKRQQQLRPSLEIAPRYDKERLKISPTTKLPTKFDRIQLLHPPEKYKIYINPTVTNPGRYQSDKAAIDCSTGKYHAVPDAGSISQWIQYTGGNYATGSSSGKGFDADPIRAVQNRKARKRKEAVRKIKKIYGQD